MTRPPLLTTDADAVGVAASSAQTGRRDASEKSLSSPETVFRGIVEGVYVGRYVPGQRLVETDLIRDFGVSRGSVREALNRLAAEGIILLHPHRGAEIRRLSRKEALDILGLLEVLVGYACRLAASRIEDGDHREQIRESIARLLDVELSQDSFEFVRRRNRFYRVMLDMGNNKELARIVPTIHIHLVRTQTRAFTQEQVNERFDDYRDMAKAILLADVDAAEKAGRAHVGHVIRLLDMVDDRAFSPG